MGRKISQDQFAVILIDSTGHAIQIEKLLLNNSITCKLIPVPRQLSSDCGVCVRVNKTEKEIIIKLLSAHKIDFNSIHNI